MTAHYVFVACQSHSGSTLLESLLATAPNTLVMGEIAHFSPYFDASAERCGCGVPVSECPFWRAVLRRLNLPATPPLERHFPTDGWRRRWGPANAPYLGLLMSPPPALELCERLPGTTAWHNRRCILNHWRLVDAAAQESGARLLVDKSMSASRLVEVARKRPNRFRVCALHLVRDARANAHSHRKLFQTPLHHVAREWAQVNARIERAMRALPAGVPTLRVRYEDLCTAPEETLRSIAEAFGMDAPFDLTAMGAATHAIGGNYARLSRGYRKVELDTRWARELDPGELEQIRKVAGSLNQRYGYKDTGVF